VNAPCEGNSDDVNYSFYAELGSLFEIFPRCNMKILSDDFNAKVGREDIFKPTTENDSSQKISNYNGVTTVNFAKFKNSDAKSTMIPPRNIPKYPWTS
jgi:hypothetical protein